MPRRVIAELVARHAQDASFLWLLRDRACGAPQYTLADLAKLDRRLEAQLDALRIDSKRGWRAVQKALVDAMEPGELFVAAVLAFEGTEESRVESVLKAAGGGLERMRAAASALGWLPASVAERRAAPLLAAESPALRQIGLAGLVAQRFNPGHALERALRDPDPALRARAFKAVGEMGYPVWLPLLRKHFRADNLPCRFAATWSAARLSDDPEPVAELMAIALIEPRFARRCADMAVRKLDPGAGRNWVRMLGHTAGLERLAIHAAGTLGDPTSLPWLLEKIAEPGLARAAGEAVSWITGVDFAAEGLEGQRPQGFEAGPTEDPDDPNVELDPDENLPWPDRAKLERWWSANRGRYAEGVRHLYGRPLTPDWLTQVLRTGTQRLRAAAALELGLRQPRQPLYEVRAPGWRQG